MKIKSNCTECHGEGKIEAINDFGFSRKLACPACIAVERDALAAHLEAMVDAAEEIDADDVFRSDVWRLHELCRGAPETSLAQRKAQWQAETLEGVLSDFDTLIENDNEARFGAAADPLADAVSVVKAHLADKIATGD